jgi:hypothetical protein
MQLLDSNFVKALHLFASFITIFSFVFGGVGAYVGVDLKGSEWGKPLSVFVGGFVGLVLFLVVAQVLFYWV